MGYFCRLLPVLISLSEVEQLPEGMTYCCCAIFIGDDEGSEGSEVVTDGIHGIDGTDVSSGNSDKFDWFCGVVVT